MFLWVIFHVSLTDVTPPIIECPEDIKTYTDKGTSYATVEWTVSEPQGKMNLNPTKDLKCLLSVIFLSCMLYLFKHLNYCNMTIT